MYAHCLETHDNPTCQPYMINHLTVLALSEGSINQTGLVSLTTLVNVKGGLHPKTFSSILETLKQKMFGTATNAMLRQTSQCDFSTKKYMESVKGHFSCQ